MGSPPLGRSWPPHVYEVGLEKIREYSSAIGEDAPHFHDPAGARAAGFDRVVAPPLFAAVFCAPAVGAALFDPEVGLFDPARGIASYRFVHRTQSLWFERPVQAGEQLVTVASLVGADRRPDGRAERVFETVSRDGRGDMVVRARYGGVEAGSSSGAGSSRPRVGGEDSPAPDSSAEEQLPNLRFTPDRYAPVRYAGASGDFTPFHLDDEAARAIGLEGAILHGMYSLAQLVRGLIAPFGSDPRALRALEARFRRPARPERELVASARIVERQGGRLRVAAELWQDGMPVISDAEATLDPTRGTGAPG